jgi:hypothetical protein
LTSKTSHLPRNVHWNPFSLRIFGNELLDTSASHAIAWRTVIVVATASIDGVAWAATGWEAAGYAGMLFLGPIAAVMVFIADAAYLTADSSAATEKRGLSDAPAEKKSKWRIKKAWVALAFRISLALGTTLVSGPSLISLFMHTDVNNELKTEASDERATQRPQPTAEMKTLKTNIDSLTVDIANEIAGRNQRGGDCGRVCRAMQQQQGELQKQYATLERDLKTADGSFDAASEKWIHDRVQSAGPAERETALNTLKDTPGYKTKRLTVSGMIWLLLTVMVVLKILEPIELKLYFSRFMQSMWPTLKLKFGDMSALFFFERLKAGCWRLAHLIVRMAALKPKVEEAQEKSKRLSEDRATAQSRVDEVRQQQVEHGTAVANITHMLATVDIATARFPVENWNKQLDAAKGRVEEARRALPAEEGNLLQLDYELQLAKREESRLQGELDKLQELIDTTTRSIDDSAINDGPHEFPAAMRTVSGRPVGSPT